MKFLLYIFSTLIVIALNIVLLSIFSPDFRSNLFKYLQRENHKIREFVSTLADTTDESNTNDSTSVEVERPVQNILEVNDYKQLNMPAFGESKKNGIARSENVVSKNLDKTIIDTIVTAIPGQPGNQASQIVDNEMAYLSKEEGILFIESKPDSAQVWIRNKLLGVTPTTIRINPPGIYQVKVTSRYHTSWEKPIKVYPAEVTKVIARLETGESVLTVLSKPQKANVWIDSELKGTTPLTIQPISAGIHQLRLVKNQLEYEGKIEILSNESKTVDIQLNMLRANLTIISEPSEANIFIDGYFMGRTPAEVEKIQLGKHQIIITSGKQLAFVDSIEVSLDGEKRFFAKLENKNKFGRIFSANLKVNSDIGKAYVSINGDNFGIIPLEIDNLHTGEHELTIIKPIYNGYLYYKDKFFLQSYETKEIFIEKGSFKYHRK